jgi:hypothetical protein
MPKKHFREKQTGSFLLRLPAVLELPERFASKTRPQGSSMMRGSNREYSQTIETSMQEVTSVARSTAQIEE